MSFPSLLYHWRYFLFFLYYILYTCKSYKDRSFADRGIYYWLSILAFFLPPCCLSQVSGRKDKTLYFIPPNFSRKKFEWILLLNGACLFTHIWVDNSYQASRFQILYLEHLNFFLLTKKKKTAFQVLFLWRLLPFALQHFIFNVAPSLESGCKSTWTFFSSKSYHHAPCVKLCLIADSQILCKNDSCYFLSG